VFVSARRQFVRIRTNLSLSFTSSRMSSIATGKPGSSPMLKKLVRKLREHGVAETARIVRKTVTYRYWQYENARFDRRANVDTDGSIEPAQLAIDSNNAQHGVRYEPTPLRTFRSMMSNLPRDLSSFTFVDFGSGKGRVLLLASHHNFAKVVGVEYAR